MVTTPTFMEGASPTPPHLAVRLIPSIPTPADQVSPSQESSIWLWHYLIKEALFALAPWVTHSTHMLCFLTKATWSTKPHLTQVLSFHDGLTKKNNNLSISCSQINLAIMLRKRKQIEPVCQLEHSACCLLWLLLYIGLKLNVKQCLAQKLHDCP